MITGIFFRARPAVVFLITGLVAFTTGIRPGPLAAQEASVTVRGIAYDSLNNEPLEGAVISVISTGKTTISDRRGRFEVDGIAPGTYTFTMNHDALDSLGLTGVSARIEVSDDRREIRLSVPSFAAFWSAGCASRAPRDSILVYGAVRHPSDLSPVRDAKVELAWIDLSVKGRKQVSQQTQTLSTMTDSTGAFGFCGVPKGAGLRIRASTDVAASGVVDLTPNETRVRWRDLTIGQYVNIDSTQVGTIAGVVLRGPGTPIPGARVLMDEAPETRTDDAGRFAIPGVPAGTRQLQVLAVGTEPVSRVVDVAVNRTNDIVVNMDRVATLAPARITGSPFIRHMAEGIAERQKLSFGTFLDSTDFAGHGTTRTAFEGVAGLVVRPVGRQYALLLKESAANQCAANLFVDGVRQMDQERLWSLAPDEVKAVEIYRRGSLVPPEFQVVRSNCGSVAVWTRQVFP